MSKRPVSLVLLSLLFSVWGIAGVYGAFRALSKATGWSPGSFHLITGQTITGIEFSPFASAIYQLVLGLPAAVIAVGLFKRLAWGRMGAIVWFTCILLYNVVVRRGDDWYGNVFYVVISLMIINWLWKQPNKEGQI